MKIYGDEGIVGDEEILEFFSGKYWYRYEEEEERRQLKVKKIRCRRFTVNTIDMQSNG